MPAELMYGAPVVDEMLARINSQEQRATLAIVQVGHLAESDSYVTQTKKTRERVAGLGFALHELPTDISLEDFRKEIMHLNDDPETTGYMLQLPLPPHLQDQFATIRRWIAARKDMDLLGHEQRGILFSEKVENQIVPPTPYAVMKMLQHYGVNVRGKIAVVVGDGRVGKPLKVMLGHDGATHIVCNEWTQDLPTLTRLGDIVVGAVGIPDIITGDMIKEGAVVVNVGMKQLDDGTWHGDVHVPSVRERAAMVTPVRGGLGPVTVAALIQNVFRAASQQQD